MKLLKGIGVVIVICFVAFAVFEIMRFDYEVFKHKYPNADVTDWLWSGGK